MSIENKTFVLIQKYQNESDEQQFAKQYSPKTMTEWYGVLKF